MTAVVLRTVTKEMHSSKVVCNSHEKKIYHNYMINEPHRMIFPIDEV
jgi:hypothetical protein